MGNLATTPSKITVMEDDSLRLGVSLDSLVKMKKDLGYKVVHTYHHPAVGKCIVMVK